MLLLLLLFVLLNSLDCSSIQRRHWFLPRTWRNFRI